MKKKTESDIFKLSQTGPGIQFKKEKGGNQPPKNKIEIKALINNILAYSPKKNNANVIAEYSTLYPDTNSASASGKSNGCLLVSASIEIENIMKAGNKGMKYQILF